ncbi:3515_t:CDS:2 [Dentiscutata erythropus]|uniref:3515_t:CDS:1 n=1 Tax=Dentiscutata erythropus TaxID=1348616 RepID=A0A9N8VHZ4_9GLOM|nr:3515_t:CDS:2 [Dentiscutata erythropus]
MQTPEESSNSSRSSTTDKDLMPLARMSTVDVSTKSFINKDVSDDYYGHNLLENFEGVYMGENVFKDYFFVLPTLPGASFSPVATVPPGCIFFARPTYGFFTCQSR